MSEGTGTAWAATRLYAAACPCCLSRARRRPHPAEPAAESRAGSARSRVYNRAAARSAPLTDAVRRGRLKQVQVGVGSAADDRQRARRHATGRWCHARCPTGSARRTPDRSGTVGYPAACFARSVLDGPRTERRYATTRGRYPICPVHQLNRNARLAVIGHCAGTGPYVVYVPKDTVPILHAGAGGAAWTAAGRATAARARGRVLPPPCGCRPRACPAGCGGAA